ncbi:EAL domain-containing protein [Actinoplanes sp. NPDC049316]|uniref:sensor domain-containing protein n=1 Tax=Actinoplanes sp. NPDC049316 TaxID=3154727 RepID=UPI003448EF71
MRTDLVDLDWLTRSGGREDVVELALSASSMVMWRLALSDGTLRWSPGFAEVLGMPGADDTALGARLRELLAPMITAANTAIVWQDLELEQPSVASDGAPRWVYFRARVVGEGSQRAMVGIATDVTDRHESRQALADLAERYRALVELGPDAIAVHQDGLVVYANPATLRYMGATSSTDLIGRRISDFVHPDSVPEMMGRLATLDALGAASEPAEAKMVRLDDSVFPAESVSVRTLWEGRPAFQVILRDISAQKASEAALRQAEQHYTTVVSALEEGVLVVGATGLVESVNPAAEQILGVTAADVAGSELCNSALMGPVGQTRRTGRSQNGRAVRVRRPDGRQVWISLSCHPLNAETGAPYATVASFTDITEQRAIGQRLAYEASHDPLTGLANRALVMQRITAVRGTTRTAVLFVDLDKFKVINDSLGHAIGDKVLQVAGERLRRAVRGTDLVSRLGGDEFAIMAADVTGPDQVRSLAERVGAVLREPVVIDGRQLHIDASVGIVLAEPADLRTAEQLLRDADLAMYQAKTRGRGRHEFFDVALRERMQRRLGLEQDLRAATDNGELWVAYQPVVQLPTARMVGVEALLRWNHPVHGPISPVEFIPLAEESGLILEIGPHTLWETSHEVARRRAVTHPDLHVAVNLSPAQLDDPELTSTVRAALDSSGLPASALCLEITESMLMRDQAAATQRLNALRELGVRLAIDDFGTGYSSFAQLRRLPLDTLKIDRSFVNGLGESRDADAIVRSIIAMAHAVDLTVVAEGVETEQQLEVLQQFGCDLAQGFYFGRPTVQPGTFPA